MQVPTEVCVPVEGPQIQPLSMCTLQTCPSAAAPAVADVPAAITATKQTNAQVKARELIIFLVNFVFIVFFLSVFFFLFWPSLILRH